MSDQPNSTLPEDQSRVLRELSEVAAGTRANFTALGPTLSPDRGGGDTSSGCRQALDSIEFDRLPTLVGDLDDPALGLGDTRPADPVLQLRMQQALRGLLVAASGIRDILTPASSAPSILAAQMLPGTCVSILVAVREFLHVAEVGLEHQIDDSTTAEPPEIHLCTGTRFGRLQIEVAIGEIQDGQLRFRETIGNGTPTAPATETGS